MIILMLVPYRLTRGFAHVVFIVIGAIILIVIILASTGILKFNGKFEITKNKPSTETVSQTSDKTVAEEKPNPSPSPKALALTKTYSSTNLKMEIKYPENWTIEENSRGATINAPKTDILSDAKSDAIVVLTSTPLGTLKGLQLSTIADVMKNQMGNFLPGATVAKSSQTQVNSEEAYLFELDYSNQGQNYPSNFYLLADSEDLYGVITSVSESKKGTYEETLKATVDTFKIL